MKTRLLIILASVGLLVSVPHAFPSESFHGTSSFENVPLELTPGESTKFEIKFRYTEDPYALSNLSPIIDVSPASAIPMVRIDVEPLEEITQGQVARIPVTVTVNPDIEHEKIFLSISFTGDRFPSRSDATYKSAWNDFISFDIASKDQIDVSSDYEIIPWDDFEYNFEGDAVMVTNNLVEISIIESGQEYYVIQKAEFRESSFGDKDTRVNATIGYAIQPGDQMLHPPMHENTTDEEHEEFSMNMYQQSQEFPKQSSIGKKYDFVVDVDNPFYIKFPLVIEDPGQYTRQFYKTIHIFQGPGSSGMGGLVVVDKFSNAVDENGVCKNENFRRLIKHDYSTVVCIDSQTAWKLIGRGWGL